MHNECINESPTGVVKANHTIENKMLGGYPPAFFMPIKDKFKMLGGYPPAFLCQ
jgi:hypothetical protein